MDWSLSAVVLTLLLSFLGAWMYDAFKESLKERRPTWAARAAKARLADIGNLDKTDYYWRLVGKCGFGAVQALASFVIAFGIGGLSVIGSSLGWLSGVAYWAVFLLYCAVLIRAYWYVDVVYEGFRFMYRSSADFERTLRELRAKAETLTDDAERSPVGG